LLTPERSIRTLFTSRKAERIGVEVVALAVIGDDVAARGSVRGALARSEIVIVTGGLGPTEDDVTREAVAVALGRELIFHDEIRERIEQRFRRMGRRMVEINKRQAWRSKGPSGC
jgi:molybdopterin-biosynthesis enzyme MoeA-like protein